MRPMDPMDNTHTRHYNRGRARQFILLCVQLVTPLFVGGCDSLYTRRARELDAQYQQGHMPREDYMRQVHETEDQQRR